MTDNYQLIAPGPVQVPPNVLKEFAKPMIHHRTPEFTQILKESKSLLKAAFATENEVFCLSATGSGAMEAACVNLVECGDKVICINSGKFGERWRDMARILGAQVIEIKVSWGESLNLSILEKTLKENTDAKVLFTQMCETSTGALHDIKGVKDLLNKNAPDCLLAVDAITGLLTAPLPMDDWAIDCIVAGSQKAFMLPTGLSFISLSARAKNKCYSCRSPRYYFDLRKEFEASEKDQTAFSSPVSHIRALKIVLEDINSSGGYNQLFSRIAKRARLTRLGIEALGLSLFPLKPAPALSVVVLPENIDGKKLRSHIEEKYNITLMGGQADLAGKIIRIGHIGYLNDSNVLAAVEALAKALLDFGHPLNIEGALDSMKAELK
ncbi:MAG: alanine--glyoxylate aminotransferase family protein [Bdellovibrionales bacterium]